MQHQHHLTTTGYIYRLLLDKGYGFIRGEDGLHRFFHAKDVAGTFDLLKEGQHVEFMSVQDARYSEKLAAKLAAKFVKPLSTLRVL